jgi:hypothetical protein
VRNKYPGKCYRCGQPVGPGDGHFERYNKGWRVQHAGCAISHRGINKRAQEEPNASNSNQNQGPA